MNSKSLNYYENKGLIIEERSIPKISNDQMLIKVQSCGICGSDIKILKYGNPRVSSGRIMGHEISGEVVDVGGLLEGFKIGDKVSIGADIPDKGDLAYGHELDGGFSQYMVLESTHIKNGPIEKFKDIDYDIAALAEPLACCLNGYEKVQFKNYQSVLILGGGVIGLILSFIATLKNIPKIYIADISKERIKNFEKFEFITDYYDINHIKEKNDDFDLIFTANNNPKSQQQAIELINSGGVINLFGGLPKDQSYVDINTNKIHYKEVIVTGSHGSSPEQHKQAIEIIEEHSSFFTMLISKKFTIADFEKAFKEATNPRNYKVIIKPNKN
jgi:L-iditol 2-dehydrogenase